MMWESHEEFKPFLDEAWQAGGKATSMVELKEKLGRVSGSLDGWMGENDLWACPKGDTHAQ
jgi:hypothetical protein